MTAYATRAQLNAYLPAASALADDAETTRLLTRASEAIDDAVRARYGVDSDGLPTDPEIAAALGSATVRQVEQWLEVGEENAVDGLAGTQIAVAGYSGGRAPAIAPRAYQVLKLAGLTMPVALTEARLLTDPDGWPS